MNKFISLDCESNNLADGHGHFGKPYAVAMQVWQNGEVISQFCGSCKIEGEIGDWLQKNPHLLTVNHSIQYSSYEEMMREAASFYLWHSCRNDQGEVVQSWGAPDHNTTPVLYHCGMTVEGEFFRELKRLELIGIFQAPMAPIEVGDYLRLAGENPYSVDAYAQKHGIALPAGETHNPLYDCDIAARVFLHLQRPQVAANTAPVDEGEKKWWITWKKEDGRFITHARGFMTEKEVMKTEMMRKSFDSEQEMIQYLNGVRITTGPVVYLY